MSAPDVKDLNDPLSHSQLQKLLQEPDTLEVGVIARIS